MTVHQETKGHPANAPVVLPVVTSDYQVDMKRLGDYDYLTNTSVKNFVWQNVNINVKDRKSKQIKTIVSSSNGIVSAGELLAIMGPSGCGKTTLLDFLARRTTKSGATTDGLLYLNGSELPKSKTSRISSYVEQEDALTGSLTVHETMNFAARLALSRSITREERESRINELIAAFGLREQAEQLIGTPIVKGISGGQRRRVSIASQLITAPKILFLDEPTSGLDSVASYEVMSFVKNIAKQHNILVIASIHQPSTSTFALFDKLLLMSGGKTVYNDTIANVRPYFQDCGFPMPTYINPAEFVLDLVSTDFFSNKDEARSKVEGFCTSWMISSNMAALTVGLQSSIQSGGGIGSLEFERTRTTDRLFVPITLVHRSFIKSYRDLVAYGIRIAMYIGLAIMMGTVWLRLSTEQKNIIPITNAIFFGGAFMSFMAVAYIPAFLEDRALYVKERANGLYGPTSFMVANFIIGLPYLFLISLLFSTIAYWLSNFNPTATRFFTWIMWLFLDLVAAESLVVLISSLVPIFVVALAAVAFANGLWMCVNGFMLSPTTLNVFWRYVFHYIDYQAYVFQGMMVNEFSGRVYDCEATADGQSCYCMYESSLSSSCKVDGRGVLAVYGYDEDQTGRLVGILLAIVLGYRLLGWLVLYLRKT